MVLNVVAVIGGLMILLGSGEMLVRGAVGLASRLNVPTLVIGLTVVAFGTSAPELVVSVQAVTGGENGIAIGNIVGSNIANILLVLGLPALTAAIGLHTPGLWKHALVMLIATAMFFGVVYSRGSLDPTVGIIFLATILCYITYLGVTANTGGGSNLAEEAAELSEADAGLPKVLVALAVGLVGLPLGGWLLVTYGAELARALNVREEIVGLTVVAFGTSLPELATVWAAAIKKEADVAVGNIVGSNIFNILFVGGAAGLAGTTQFTDPLLGGYSEVVSTIDLPVMAISSVILAVLIFLRSKIARLTGLAFVISYAVYIIVTSMAGSS